LKFLPLMMKAACSHKERLPLSRGDNENPMKSLKLSNMARVCILVIVALILPSCGGGGDSGDASQGGGVSNTARILPANYVSQQTQVWCWAAVTSEMLTYYGVQNYQCQLVGLVTYNVVNACCGTGDPACLTTASLETMEYLVYQLTSGRVSMYEIQGALSFDQVVATIDAGNPFVIGYEGSFSGHVVLVVGYDKSSQEIYIHDPYYGIFTVPYATTFVYNGSLVWAQTLVVN
jgi:hypothetical protein